MKSVLRTLALAMILSISIASCETGVSVAPAAKGPDVLATSEDLLELLATRNDAIVEGLDRIKQITFAGSVSSRA